MVTAYTAIFRRDALGQLRGDVIAGLAYVSNWYQIWVGQGYTASGDFAPLRHLWSLAVEEQFYLLWPLAMIVILRLGARRVQNVSWAFVAAAVAIAGVVAALYHPGPIATCELTPEAYWQLGDRCISKTDFLYLSTPTRAGGLLLGAALAMVWRPVALMRGPMRRRGRLLDVVGVVGFVTLGALTWYVHVVTPDGADAWLFRGGFLITGLATVAVIAAVTHRGTAAGPAMGNVVLVWIGVRSYGLYLYHWPIFQGIRRVAGNALTVPEFLVGVAATVVVADVSYRVIEIPIRRGTFGRWWRRLQLTRTDGARRIVASAGALLVALIVFAAVSVGTAPLRANEIATAQAEAAQFVGDPFAAASAARPDGLLDLATPADATPDDDGQVDDDDDVDVHHRGLDEHHGRAGVDDHRTDDDGPAHDRRRTTGTGPCRHHRRRAIRARRPPSTAMPSATRSCSGRPATSPRRASASTPSCPGRSSTGSTR